jgi:replicative DNA helicase
MQPHPVAFPYIEKDHRPMDRTATTTQLDISNLELEQGILGALLGDTDLSLWPQITGQLRPEYFAEPLHSRIFEAAATLAASGTAPTAVVMISYFGKDATLAEIGPQYLAGLVGNASTAFQLKAHAAMLQDLAARRAAVALARDLEQAASTATPGESFRPVLAQHVEAAQSLFDAGSSRRTTFSAGEAASAMIQRIARMRDGQVDPNAIKTGLASLDRQIGGLHRGEYIILGARPSMGKTATALQIAANVAHRRGGVLYFSLEMPAHLIMPRLASGHLWTAHGSTNVPYSRIIRGDVSDMEARWLSAFSQEIKDWPLIIDDAAGLSAVEMEARAQVAKSRMERAGHSLDLIIVDHLHKMRHPGATGKTAEFTEISSRLAEMAKRLNCPVLTLAQLNRGVEGRDDKRPQLSDLRESGSIEQDADVAMFVYRPAYYLDRERHADSNKEIERLQALAAVQNRLDVIIEKQRSGPIGTVELFCDMASNAVRDRAEFSHPGLESAA